MYKGTKTIKGIKLSLKLAFLWTGLIISIIIVQTMRIGTILVIVGVGVTIHLLLIKTKQETNSKNQHEGEVKEWQT